MLFCKPMSFFGLSCLLACSLFAQQAAVEQKDVSSAALTANNESRTVLSISQLGLESQPPIPGGKAEFPEFTRELVRLQWRAGDPIDIYVITPRGVKKPRAILYLYGHTSDSTRFRNDQWCQSATEGGFAAIGFVSALTGERYRGRAMTKWFVSELAESLATTTHDVQMVLNYLAERGDLNMDRTGMYAQGSGASIAILAASVDSRITVLDVLNPWGDWPDWLKQSPIVPENERSTYLRPEFLAQVAMLDPVDTLPKMKTQTIRIQQSAGDLGVPKSVRERIASAAVRPEEVVLYKDAAGFRKAWEAGRPWGWIKDHLEPTPAQLSATRTNEQKNPEDGSDRHE
jgi:hypothetical protein